MIGGGDRGGRATCSSGRSARSSGDACTTTSLDEVEIVTAELGTWAGAIGAAVHGAEAAERAMRPRGRPGRDDRDRLPHYRRIELALRERLATMQPGERLPSDEELCAEFGVSRMTARNAMQRLADDGLVRGSRAAGPSWPRRRRTATPTG